MTDTITETDALRLLQNLAEVEPTIEAICRPIMQAQRLLRDHLAACRAFNPRPTADDAPDADAIHRAVQAVQAALSTVVTAESVEAIFGQMVDLFTMDKSKPPANFAVEDLVAAVVNRDALSIALDGPLPVVAVALAVRKTHDVVGFPSPEQFLRSCVRARREIETLLNALLEARARMRSRR